MTATERDVFLAERRTGIGGSDIQHIFNSEPYGCARMLWYGKRGTDPDRGSISEITGPMVRGQKLEDLVAQEYAAQTRREVRRIPMIRHPHHPELLVHIDRAIEPAVPAFVSPDASDTYLDWGRGILECKTAAREVFFKIKREGMPDGYIFQLQHAMGVTDVKWGSFALLWPDGWQVLWWDLEADPKLQESIRVEALKFWALVENGPAPDRLPPEDARCHRCPFSGQCQGAAIEELMRAAGAGAVVDRTLGPLVREFLDTKALVDEAEEIHGGVKENLKAAMGDRILVEVPGMGKIHYKANREWDTVSLEAVRPDIARAFKTNWDLTALGKAHPELEAKFKRVGTTRPLRIYPAR